ncbi:hypothetical protein GCM10027187_55670 [Streptosporangium sandarakinum]
MTPPLPEESGFSLSSAEVGDGQALPVLNTGTISMKRFPHRVNPAVPSLDLMEVLDGLADERLRLELLLIEALHREAERLAAQAGLT